MRTLHVGLRVVDIERSLSFYGALGYRVLGRVPGTEQGDLTMLALPDDPFVALELVHVPDVPFSVGGINHLVIQVESMTRSSELLASRGITVENVALHDAETGFTTAWLTDPDGYRIELVQWPDGHGDGMTREDFAGQ